MSSSVLVLGASGILGKAVSESFSRDGWKVLGTGFRRKPDLESFIQLDLTLSSEVSRLGTWLDEQNQKIDVVVHCVGIALDKSIATMEESDWKNVLDVNLKSAYLVSKLLASKLMKQRSGHLIFISSWGGLRGRAGQTNYAAAKAGLIALTQSLAREYASRNVLANCIIPGVFKSPMTDAMKPEALENLWKDSAFKQFADLQETSNFIVHLASMKGVTGQVFHLDGRIPPVF